MARWETAEKEGEGKGKGERKRGKEAERREVEAGGGRTGKGGTLELVTPAGLISSRVPPCPRKGKLCKPGSGRAGRGCTMDLGVISSRVPPCRIQGRKAGGAGGAAGRAGR